MPTSTPTRAGSRTPTATSTRAKRPGSFAPGDGTFAGVATNHTIPGPHAVGATPRRRTGRPGGSGWQVDRERERAVPGTLTFTPEVARATEHILAQGGGQPSTLRVGAQGPAHRRDQPAQAGAERRHPGAQLPGARDLPRRRGLQGRLPGSGAGGAGHGRGRDRVLRRALHGRDGQDPEPRANGPHPGPGRGLLPVGEHHGRGRSPTQGAPPRRAGRHLREHAGLHQGRVGHLLHVGQRGAGRGGGGGARRLGPGHLPARRVPGEQRSQRRPTCG